MWKDEKIKDLVRDTAEQSLTSLSCLNFKPEATPLLNTKQAKVFNTSQQQGELGQLRISSAVDFLSDCDGSGWYFLSQWNWWEDRRSNPQGAFLSKHPPLCDPGVGVGAFQNYNYNRFPEFIDINITALKNLLHYVMEKLTSVFLRFLLSLQNRWQVVSHHGWYRYRGTACLLWVSVILLLRLEVSFCRLQQN